MKVRWSVPHRLQNRGHFSHWLLILQLCTDPDILYVDVVQYHTIRSINSDYLNLLNIINLLSFFTQASNI